MPTYQQFLDDRSADRIILVEINYYHTVNGNSSLYLSNRGYSTTTNDVVILPILKGGLSFTETLSNDGSISVSFGDIAVVNNNGLYDYLLGSNYIWSNTSVKAYYGNPTLLYSNITNVKAAYECIFSGVVTGLECKDASTLNFKVLDALQKLNNPLMEAKLGNTGTWPSGSYPNAEVLKPLVFGEVYNMEPLLIDPATMEYMFSSGVSEQLIEIRDNGVPVYNSSIPTGATVNLTLSTFKLAKPLIGVCTCSVQGTKQSVNLSSNSALVNSYVNNIANIISLIVTQYGNPLTRLNGTTEIDNTNFNLFATANTAAIGLVLLDRSNVLSVCQDLASSIGAQVYMTRKGLLRLLKLGTFLDGDTPVNIDISSILANSFSISSRSTVSASTKIGYGRNWTLQTNLITAIPSQSKESFATEWLSSTATNTTVKNNYKLFTDPVQKDTLLITSSDAVAEASRLNTLTSVQRTIYKFRGTSSLLSLELGQEVFLKFPRFGLDAGVSGQVVSLTPDWAAAQIDIEVMI